MDLQANADLTLSDYLAVLHRRGALLCAIMATVVLIGFAIAYRIPPLYASTGILLAERPEVPEHVVRSTVPDDPEDRVQIITQRVLTSANLGRIIADNSLYPELAATPADALGEFRDHLSLSAEDPQILEDLLGPSRTGDAIAFSLTFTDPAPQVARDVAKGLVALYLEENQRARREQAEQTSRFLTQEAERLEIEIDAREEKLAEFKREHVGGLPSDLDRQLIDRVERDLLSVEQEIRSLRERRAMYAAELAQTSPHAPVVDEEGQNILGPDERRTLLERRYAQLSAIYSQDHPDVLKVRREIAALRTAGGGAASDGGSLQTELAAREEQLAAARSRYSADHPDVQRLERTVESLRTALAQTAARGNYPALPDNPQFIQRKLQLDTAESEVQLALARRSELTARLAEFERRAIVAPDVERELNALNRGYEQLLAQYDDVQRKLREAEIAVNLESEGRGDRFTTLETPQLPLTPESPNRLAVLLLTVIAAFTLGASGVAIAERCDTTIR
ncbi:MAG TPA: hypothetical protein VFB99_06305, partial [Vicinamibacterales bacterium]|nr:hypothetical protein [Vicinamibacterales bacterium]